MSTRALCDDIEIGHVLGVTVVVSVFHDEWRMLGFNHEYAGRMFMLPPELEAAGQQELWINIGAHTGGDRALPEYIEALEPICTREQFLQFMADIKEFTSSHTVHPCLTMSALIVCVTCFLPLPLLCVNQKISHFSSGLKELVTSASTKTIPVKMRMVYARVTPTPHFKVHPCDQFGKELLHTFTTDESCVTEKIWPPHGYNIILEVPSSYNLRAHWPPVISSPPTASTVLNASSGGIPTPIHPAEQLQALEDLRSSSMITESEYMTKRAAIIAQL
jgi:hypothetical protein